ncbi:hypothetical protein OE88DRAFT_1621636 [Heliocybe sulcata]|uniref:RRN7-type domain-containing protein n=1 Tax=Heliocybe sulcata TaxID=5364 RepID=A0A5C3NE00_9AGAM|nr:hypothetical protein OE88DRAFT_1621636 [Heliocybe sulcata]
MALRKKCPVCGSRKWHKEPSSGLITCSEGHVLQNYRNETNEAEDFVPHAMRKRTLKSSRKKKEKLSKADPLLYHGPRAHYHYFQCLQLIFRKQVAALTRLWDLPAEYETVCRDLWVLHLGLLPSPPSAEPYHHAREQQGDRPPEARVTSLQTPRPTQTPTEGASDSEDEGRKQAADHSSSSSESSDAESDPEMAALMREASETSSSEDEDAREKPPQPDSAAKRTGKHRTYSKYDAPVNTIAVLVLACWTLRLPVVYNDFVKVIEAYELPYLDPVRRGIIPSSMTAHLTKQTVQALSPHYAPDVLALHTLVSRLAKLMQTSYGIWTPELNAAPVLWRVVRDLGGTPVLYTLTKTISHTLSLTLSLHYSLAPKLEKARQSDAERYHQFDNVPPEVSLVAAAIVVLRLVYGLDGSPRVPNEKEDPACSLPRLQEYLSYVKELNADQVRGKDALFSAALPLHVTDMTDGTLDVYISFCERALLGKSDIPGEYFPIREGDSGHENSAAPIRESTSRRNVPPTALHQVSDTGDLRPGEAFKIFSARDVFGALPGEYQLVVDKAAGWVGVSEECMCAVVERLERRLIRWWDSVRRKERRASRGEDEDR